MNRFSPLLCVSFALLLGALPWPAVALQVTGLYTERVAVDNESDAERSRAFQQALQAVILKVTGERRWLDHPAVERAVRDANRYVEAISYSSETVDLPPPAQAPVPPSPSPAADDVEPDVPARPGPSPVAPTSREQRYITVEFAPSLVNQMLADADIPVWDSNRPSVLVWMVLQNANGDRTMLTADSNPQIMSLMREFAARRGLPIIFPVLDFADRQNLSDDQVWALDEDAIRAASQRYGADSIIAARLHFTASGQLVGLWQFIFQDEVTVFDGFAEDLQDYLFSPLDRITTQLAGYFAITPETTPQQEVALRVEGVDDLAAYAALVNYVTNLGLVQRVTTTGLDGTRLDLRVSLLGSAEQLDELIALDRDLLPVGSDADSPGPLLHYRWTR